MADNKEAVAVNNPLSSIISKFTQVFNFSFPPPQVKKVETERKVGGEVIKEELKPVSVRFSDASVDSIEPLKVEAQEVDKDTNPVFLWQVYAIGGFFILRWVLARWNEQKANKKSDEDSPPQPPPAAAADGDE